jgi:hypothetical protein
MFKKAVHEWVLQRLCESAQFLNLKKGRVARGGLSPNHAMITYLHALKPHAARKDAFKKWLIIIAYVHGVEYDNQIHAYNMKDRKE